MSENGCARGDGDARFTSTENTVNSVESDTTKIVSIAAKALKRVEYPQLSQKIKLNGLFIRG